MASKLIVGMIVEGLHHVFILSKETNQFLQHGYSEGRLVNNPMRAKPDQHKMSCK